MKWKYQIIILGQFADKKNGKLFVDKDGFILREKDTAEQRYALSDVQQLQWQPLGGGAHRLRRICVLLTLFASLGMLFMQFVSAALISILAILVMVLLWRTNSSCMILTFHDGKQVILPGNIRFPAALRAIQPKLVAIKKQRQHLIPFLFRLLLGMVCWGLSAFLIFSLIEPGKQAPDSIFSVCILQGERPVMVRLAERQKWEGKTLCPAPWQYVDADYGAYQVTMRWQDDVYVVETYDDSPGDPLVYAYRIEDDASSVGITPLWEKRGGLMLKAIAVFLLSVPFASVLYALFSCDLYSYVKNIARKR